MANIEKIIDDWAILGRPGYAGRKKNLRRSEIQKIFGDGNWMIAHLIGDKLLPREEALKYFEESYYQYFANNPEILDWLILTAKDVYDTDESNVNSGLDYSIQETDAAHLNDIAIRRAIKRLGKEFQGEKLLQIHGENSEGFFLTTGEVPFHKPDIILSPQIKGWWKKNSIESFWQSNKVLATKFDKIKNMSKETIVVVLRKDISMGKGKFSTQAAHAIVSLIPERGLKWDFAKNPVEVWTVKGEENLLGIYSKVSKMKVNCSIIRDAGKTQLAPGTRTAVGIGPINEAILDSIMNDYNAIALETLMRKYRNFKNLSLRTL